MERRVLKYFAFILFLVTLGSCKKDVISTEPVITEATDANKFIYNGLSTYYLWETEVPALNNPTYLSNNDSLNAFLNKYDNPEDLFYSLLYQYGTIDKFSFIVDNSQEIDDWLAGISESVGIDFRLYYISNGSNDLVGVIRYVIKDSPADKAGLKRGDFFTTINGQQLTVANYQELLFTLTTYTMGLATYTGSGFVESGKSVTMTAVSLMEDPIYLDTVLVVNGTKVGYLVYNLFSNSFDSHINTSYDIELNNVFGKFKADGIQKLILDLRYNGGGSVMSAIYLASMIYSGNPDLLFGKEIYNPILTDYFYSQYGTEFFNDYFQDVISATDQTPAADINSLGLSDIYIIATSETASASEMVISGLKPYMSVTQVGSNTVGKYVGSFTIKDWIDNEGNVNPNDPWTMQPIVFKWANSQDFSDFYDGLTPDISATESPVNLLPLGDVNESLLKACLDNITGSKSEKIYGLPQFEPFKSSNEFSPLKNGMYIDKLPRDILNLRRKK
jgi:carboxyl-terminal processing protease